LHTRENGTFTGYNLSAIHQLTVASLLYVYIILLTDPSEVHTDSFVLN